MECKENDVMARPKQSLTTLARAAGLLQNLTALRMRLRVLVIEAAVHTARTWAEGGKRLEEGNGCKWVPVGATLGVSADRAWKKNEGFDC